MVIDGPSLILISLKVLINLFVIKGNNATGQQGI